MSRQTPTGGTSASLSQSVADFSIAASPASKTVSRNSSGTYTLTLTPIGGFTGTISLSCTGAPSNTSCSVSPAQVSLAGSNSQAVVTVTVGKHTSFGTYTLTLGASSGTLAHSAAVSLTVTN